MKKYKRLYPIGTDKCENCRHFKNPQATGYGYPNFDCTATGKKQVPLLDEFPEWCPLEKAK
jgi:hypothetical protein